MKIKNINVHFTEAEIDKKIRELGAGSVRIMQGNPYA